MSSSEEDPESGNQSSHSSSWQRLVESAVQRRRTRTRRPRGEVDGKAESEELLVSNPGAGSGGAYHGEIVGGATGSGKEGSGGRRRECKVEAMEDIRVSTELLGHGPLDSDLLPNILDGAEGAIEGVSGLAWHLTDENVGQGIEKLPSPPPLPLEWELGGDAVASSHGFLFDFGQFDSSRAAARRQSSVPHADGLGGMEGLNAEIGPHTTAVSSMTPQNMSNPSDDYIWQILFANPTDEVPKRVTAHMHNPASRNADLATLDDLGAFDPMLPEVVPGAREDGDGKREDVRKDQGGGKDGAEREGTL